MSYGELKIDTITFTAGGVDASVSVSGLVQNPTFTGNITTTGTISGDVIEGNTVSGATVTGDTGDFGNLTAVSGVFTTQVSGATVTGDVGLFTTITGGIHTLTSGVFASGTAANPSITFVDDLDSGIYASAVNEVAISTSGTGRVFVNSSGNVGIGDTPNGKRLTIHGTDTTNSVLSSASVHLVNSDAAAAGRTTSLLFGGRAASADPFAGIAGIMTSDVSFEQAGHLAFYTKETAAAGAPTERARIDSSGRLLVGTSTTSAGHKLIVEGAGEGFCLASTSTTPSDGTALSYLTFTSNNHVAAASVIARRDGGTWTNGSSQPTRLEFSTTADAASSPTERMRIDSSGDLIKVGGVIIGERGTEAAPAYSFSDDTDTGIFNIDNLHLGFSVGGTERVRIDSSGRVGIGTTEPATILTIRDAAPAIRLTADANDITELQFGDTGDTVRGNIIFRNGTGGNALCFHTNNNNEQARIDSSGRLLIGHTASIGVDSKLQIVGIGSGNRPALEMLHYENSDGSAQLTFTKSRSSTIGVAAVQSGDDLGAIYFRGANGTGIGYGAEIRSEAESTFSLSNHPSRLIFATASAASLVERMRINKDGYVTFNGTGAIVGSSKVSIAQDFTVANGLGIRNLGAQGGGQYFALFYNVSGTIAGSISHNGATTVAFNTSSDYRLKENVVPLASAADRVKQLKPSQFNFIAEPDRTVDGFIAHEVQAVVPEAITGEKDAVDDDGNPVYQGIDQSKLVPLLTAALQEALAEIESLKARLTAAGI